MKPTSWHDLAAASPGSARTLLVDDDAEVRTSVSRLLTRAGLTVQACGSAEEADRYMSLARYEVCLLDIELPRMSGIEFLGWALKRDPEMAVIMLTGLDAPDVALECMGRGARTFLVKPVEAPFLLRAVRDAVALRRLLVEHNDRTGRADPAGETAWRAYS